MRFLFPALIIALCFAQIGLMAAGAHATPTLVIIYCLTVIVSQFWPIREAVRR